MPQPTTVHATFVLERSYPAPPERVFAAFTDPSIKRRWFADTSSSDVVEFTGDTRVGGIERFEYFFRPGTPIAGRTIRNESVYQDIVPNRRLVQASGMSLDDQRISASLVTIELLPTDKGTDLICTHQGAFFEWADGPAMREGGWRLLLDRLGAELGQEAAA